MLRESIKEHHDRDLIRKAIDSIKTHKNQQNSQLRIDTDVNRNSNIFENQKKCFYPASPYQRQEQAERTLKNLQKKIVIRYEANKLNNSDVGHSQHKNQQLSLLSISQKSVDQETTIGKKRVAIYLRKSSEKSKNVILNPIKTQQIDKKSPDQKKKVFYLSINRSPLQKYDSRSQNLYHLPDFNNKNGQTPNKLDKNSNTMRYINQFISKSTNKALKINKIDHLLNQNQNNISQSQNSEKSGIVSAFPQPAKIKYKYKKSSKDTNDVFDQVHDYVMTNKMRCQLQKSLKVQSKKQQILKNNGQRYKIDNIKKKYILKTSLDKRSFSEEKQKLKKQQQSIKRQSNYRFIIKKQLVPSPKNKNASKSKRSLMDFLNYKEKLSIYDQKIMTYRQLLFLVNVAHRVFDPIILIDPLQPQKSQKNIAPKYHYYIGAGNNCKLIRALMKRRFWWSQCQDIKEADFVWTQLKIVDIYQRQQGRDVASLDVKLKSQMIQTDKDTNKIRLSTQPNINSSLIKQYIFKPPFASIDCSKILTQTDSQIYHTFIHSLSLKQYDKFDSRFKYFPEGFFSVKKRQNNIVHNHIQFNHFLGNKKALFYHLTLYYKILGKSTSTAIPQTFHIKSLDNDPNYQQFFAQYTRISKNKAMQNIWIVKPGQNSNRGTGIDVFNDVRRLKFLIKQQKYKNGQFKTYIIQKYIERPLLYQGRKFDIRHYMIVTTLYGHLRAYWYGEGYIRTSSYPFNLFQLEDSMIHLTNDAIQKQSKDYGNLEEGNKLSYIELQRYFDKNYPFRHFDFKSIYVKMRNLAKDVLCSTYQSLTQSRKIHNFEIFGLDFMIDDHLKVNLIQINTNPCLQLSSGLLARIIPLMVEQTLRVSLDAIFPPNMHYNNNSKSLAPDCSLQKLQMELIFDEIKQKQSLDTLYAAHKEEYRQMMANLTGNLYDDETFDNQGDDVEIDRLIT